MRRKKNAGNEPNGCCTEAYGSLKLRAIKNVEGMVTGKVKSLKFRRLFGVTVEDDNFVG
jgi:hypothetical protein